MKILFTGATGVIGRAALPLLAGAGHDVVAVYRSASDRRWLEELGARPVQVDLFDPEAVSKAMSGVDAVAHFATAIPRQSEMKKRASWETNDRLRAVGTGWLVDAALTHGVERFVQEGITYIYADGGEQWIDESFDIDPFWDILDSMLTAEDHVERFRAAGGTGVVLRMSRLYGPGNTSHEYIEAVRNRGIPIIGTGDNYVSSLHIEDAATAMVAALTAPDGTYNITDDEPIRAADNLLALVDALDAPQPRRIPAFVARVALGKATPLLTMSQRVSNERFSNVTGWAPKYPNAAAGWRATIGQT